jgi:arylsulfatase
MLGATMPALGDYHWELYNVAKDYSENNDLAAQMPDKLKEMQALFLVEAGKYQVFPLDNSGFARAVLPRPSAVAGKTEFTYTGVNAGIPYGNAPSILDKDYTITAEITVPEGGAEGMIVTLGGRFGGYALYLLNGKPVFDYNLLDIERFRWEGGVGGIIGDDLFGKALKPGKHTIVFDFKYDGPGPGKGGTGVFTVDGRELSRKTIKHTVPLLMTVDETFDVGVDTGTGVDDSYQLPFKFTGTIDKLTFKLGPSQMVAADQKAVDEMKKSVDN